MQTVEGRLLSLVRQSLPVAELDELSLSARLHDLGFDSMAMISLFIDLEREFSLSPEAMQKHLHRACSFGSLLDLCAGSQA